MNGIKFVTLTVVCVLFLGNLFAFSQEEAVRFRRAYEVIDGFVNRHMAEAGTPGMAMALTTADGLLRVSTYGFADIKARIPVTPETLFEIGSVTKSFTAIALMQLRDEGKFDPNVPVVEYLPWFRVKTKYESITSHHLLTHTAGIPTNRDDIPGSMFMSWALRDQSTAYAPGKRFHYSNIGYQTLHFLLERLGGGKYREIIGKRIFKPLGMGSSRAVIDHDIRRRLAVGYQFIYDDRPSHPSHPLVESTWLVYGIGDGSIVSTPGDMAAYMRMLLKRGEGPKGRILSQKSFDIFSSAFVEDGKDRFYGYGIDTGKVNGYRCLMHGGGMVGYTSFLLCDMDNGLGVMVFLNGPGDRYVLADFALKALQAALHKKEMPVSPGSLDLSRMSDVGDYAGIYTSVGGKRLNFTVEGSGLVLGYKGRRIVLERRGGDSFYVPHPDFGFFLLEFGRNGKGVVEVFYGSEWYTGSGYDGVRSFKYPKVWDAYPGYYRTQDPWFSNFRILMRRGRLVLCIAGEVGGSEAELVDVGGGLFRVGRGGMPETIRFDTIVEGRALRANFSGVNFYRIPPAARGTY